MKKSRWVLIITVSTMVFEIFYGHKTGSMALLADGWHMATHAAALGVTYMTYRLAASPRLVRNFNFGGGKFIALGGFTSSLILFVAAIMIAYEALLRFINPQTIEFNEALVVAVLGLIINLISARILHEKHGGQEAHAKRNGHDGHTHDEHSRANQHAHVGPSHEHDHFHDHNIRGAYLHVIADAITSVGAIAALLAGRIWGWYFLDSLIGIMGGLVILKWAVHLIADTGWELLDGHAKGIDYAKLKARIEAEKAEILDLHVWKVAPNMLTCELVVRPMHKRGIAHYRHILEHEFHVQHSVIEEKPTAAN